MASTRQNFTKTFIEGLPVPTGAAKWYHDLQPGLSLRVLPTGKRVFYYYKKAAGQSYQLAIGEYGAGWSIGLARERVQEMNLAVARGEDPACVGRRPRGEPTFAELFAWWMEEHGKPRVRTWQEDERRFRLYLGSIANKKAAAITRPQLRALHAQLGKKPGVPTANRTLTLVRSIYSFAIKHERFRGSNPAEGIERFPEESRDRRLNDAELGRLAEALEAEPSAALRDYVLLSLYTGARQGNVLAMRWDQLQLQGNAPTWRIPRTKNGRPQVVPLEAEELELLQARRQLVGDSPWVFPSSGKSGHLQEVARGWARICERAQLKELRPHDLRRSNGSYMVDTGASLPMVGANLGHLNTASTAIYARLSQDPLRKAKRRTLDAMRDAVAKERTAPSGAPEGE